ncbi:MAG: flavin reductase family protein [Candidatus Omnitrophota bacterium]|nr:flavin reductase family protein [Candidatus Omnitrophota bacterium]
MRHLNYQSIAKQVMKQISDKGAFLVVKAGKLNVMTIGWALIGFVWRKPMMMIVVRDSRYTFEIIEKADSFSVNVPSKNMDKELEFCGTKSGRNIDKFKECNLKTLKAQKITSPILDIPGVHYECKIVYKTKMEPKFLTKEYEYLYPNKDYHTMYFGEILGCYQTN